MINHPEIGKLEFNQITEYIYIGTNACCYTHFDEKLLALGIKADISLEEEKIDTPLGVGFYIWIPVKNHTAPTQDQLDFGVSVLKKLVAMKKKVYIHCQNGHSRAPTLVAAYLIKQGKSPDEALAFIKAKRPSIHLEDVQQEALVEFSKIINQLSCCI